MDFLGNQCPVCEKPFHADDDIVVCPDCGTPHHRACYEAIGHCANAARHGEDYDFSEDDENVNSDVVICRSCGKENDKNAFFCKYCAAPLSKADEQPQQQSSGQSAYTGNAANGGFAYPFMDPLAGVPGDADMGDGVTAGEIAKYVKQNTPYFVRVFNNIKEFNRSRFSFVGALFGGGYLLYRKMYKLGAILTALQAAMIILSVYIQIQYADEYNAVMQNNAGSFYQLFNYLSALMNSGKFILCLPYLMSGVLLVIRIAIGASVNRIYFKHCREQVVLIKKQASPNESADTVLQTKGGVNLPLAVSLLATYMVLNYLPNILYGFI